MRVMWVIHRKVRSWACYLEDYRRSQLHFFLLCPHVLCQLVLKNVNSSYLYKAFVAITCHGWDGCWMSVHWSLDIFMCQPQGGGGRGEMWSVYVRDSSQRKIRALLEQGTRLPTISTADFCAAYFWQFVLLITIFLEFNLILHKYDVFCFAFYQT